MTEKELKENLFGVLFPYSNMERVAGNELVAQILTLIKEAGYVKLADDQTLPEIPVNFYDYQDVADYRAGQYFMLKVVDGKVWRKVELEVK